MARPAPSSNASSPAQRTTRQSARLSSQPPSSPPSTPKQPKRSKGRPRKTLPDQQLQPVEEASPAEEEISDDAQPLKDPPGDQSNLSGATAVSTAHSLSEIQDLRQNVPAMLDCLADLNDDSSRILRQLAPSDSTPAQVSGLAEQLRTPNSPVWARLSASESTFTQPFDIFASKSEYIHTELVLSAMLGHIEDVNAGQWRPDDILYKANLAKLAILLMTSQPVTDNIQASLEYLDNSFANIFFSSITSETSTPGSTALLKDAFDAALALRSQLALVAAQSIADRNEFERVVGSLFLHGDQQKLINSQDRMKGWGVRSFETSKGYLKSPLQAKAFEAYQVLVSGDLDELEPQFSWTTFQFQMISWISHRISELNARIAECGGVDKINSMLREEVEKSAKGRKPAAPPRNMDKHGKAIGKLAKMLSGGSRIIKNPLQRPPASDPIPDTRERETPSARGARTLPRAGRSLIDRQPTAQRLSFDDDSQPTQSVIVVDGSGNDRGARTGDLEEPVTQDRGFGTSTAGASQRAAERRNNPEAKATSTPKKPVQGQKRTQADDADERPRTKRIRTAGEAGEDQRRGTRDATYSVPSDEESNNTSRSRPTTQPPEAPASTWVPTASNYPEANRAAKIFVSSRKAGPQQRQPWTTLETDTLREYIVKYGVSWSFIKDRDRNADETSMDVNGDYVLRGPDILARRDQVALKDKARNMKMDYLKAGHELPRNFNAVALKAKDKELLRQMGIDPDG